MYQSYNLKLLQISDNYEKYYICNICSNNNDESPEVYSYIGISIGIGAFYSQYTYWLL